MSSENFVNANTALEVVIAIGLIGNLLSVIIFLRKTFRYTSISQTKSQKWNQKT